MPVRSSRRLFLAIALPLVVAATAGYWWSTPRDAALIAGVRVNGSPEFVQQIDAALTLLRERSPDDFDMVVRYIGRIAQARRSGMNADANPPQLDLNDRTTNYSVTWCAGSIVHDAYHSKLYHEYRDKFGEPVPDSAWRGKDRELECNQLQLNVLANIGAPEFEIEHLRRQDGSHYDLDGDGEETWRDYWKRDW